jgi:hypothetical protein
MYPLITLTTDFGTHDSYVGIMKGVMLSICPDARLIDNTHHIGPQDINAAALAAQALTPYFPPHTVHLVVVDPGVGSERRPIALETPQGRYVGPDNGVFGLVWQQAREQHPPTQVRAVLLDDPRFWRPEVSATFHGRDMFAPVAAHLASGTALDALGTRIDDLITLPIHAPVFEMPTQVVGRIIYIDHFGNCISNIRAEHLAHLGPIEDLYVFIPDRWLGIVQTYANVPQGAPLALIGSDGYLEVAVRNGNANQSLGIALGTEIRVRRVS